MRADFAEASERYSNADSLVKGLRLDDETVEFSVQTDDEQHSYTLMLSDYPRASQKSLSFDFAVLSHR